MSVTDRAVAVVLRIIGVIDLLAIGAAVMPFAWMQRVHAALGLGEMPEAPVVEHLARSTSIFYAVHAVTILYLSTDVPRFRPVIRFLAWLALAHGALLLWSDIRSGMPTWWAVAESGGVIFEGVLVLLLLGLSRSPDINSTAHRHAASLDADIPAR